MCLAVICAMMCCAVVCCAVICAVLHWDVMWCAVLWHHFAIPLVSSSVLLNNATSSALKLISLPSLDIFLTDCVFDDVNCLLDTNSARTAYIVVTLSHFYHSDCLP